MAGFNELVIMKTEHDVNEVEICAELLKNSKLFDHIDIVKRDYGSYGVANKISFNLYVTQIDTIKGKVTRVCVSTEDFNFRSDNKDAERNVNVLVTIAKVIYGYVKPFWGYHEISYTMPFSEEPQITWLNFFGLNLVKKIGKGKLLSAPVYKVEELTDGGVFIQVTPFPTGNSLEIEKKYSLENLKQYLFG